MGFKNLYALLGVAPTATETEIVKAMRQLAQLQLVSLEDLKLCKDTLLNPEARKKYNAQLFAEYPEVLEELTKPKEPEAKPEHEKRNLKTRGKQKSNRKLWVYSAIFILIVLAVASGIAYTYYMPRLEVKNAVKDLLKDPESAKFYDIRKIKNDKTVVYCGGVNARTTAGGYGGKNRFVYLVEKKEAVIIPNEKPDDESDEVYYSSLWRGGCQESSLNSALGKAEKWLELHNKEKKAKEKRDSFSWESEQSEYLEASKEYLEINEEASKLKEEITIYK
ncbi:hypothetical protein ABX014_23290 [Snodgrassella alvi]|uniref:hypothetical protein n=1 Tax=Snodgrassella alvi TaxID=1196083 RepID=UPI00351C75DE